jgi:hypothetical protein
VNGVVDDAPELLEAPPPGRQLRLL